jgi:hypothetical protein
MLPISLRANQVLEIRIGDARFHCGIELVQRFHYISTRKSNPCPSLPIRSIGTTWAISISLPSVAPAFGFPFLVRLFFGVYNAGLLNMIFDGKRD